MKKKKVLIWSVLVLGSLVTLYFVVYAILNIVWGAELRNAMADIKEQGEPMTVAEIRPPALNPEDNAANLYHKIFAMMKVEEKNIEAVDVMQSVENFFLLPKEKKEKIFQIIKSEGVEEIFNQFENTANKPGLNFDLKYEQGFAMELSHLASFRALIRLLRSRACFEIENNNLKEAYRLWIIGLKMTNHLKDEPTVISQLVRYACDQSVGENIIRIAERYGIDNDDASAIISEFHKRDYIASFIKPLQFEKVSAGLFFNKAFAGEIKEEELCDLGFGPSICLIAPVIKPLLKKDYAVYLRLMSDSQSWFDRPFWELVSDPVYTGMANNIPRYCVFTRLFLPDLVRMREKVALSDSRVGICITTLALHIYKNNTGRYPDCLEELTPQILEKLPLDPFTGKNFIYQADNDKFSLKSGNSEKK